MKAVILAAGKSSRFWPLNKKHKSLIKIIGKPIIYWTLLGLKKLKIDEIILIQSPKKDIEKELENYKIPGLKIRYLIQKEPKGMGNALWQAKDFLKERFLVLNAERVDIDEIVSRKEILSDSPLLIGQKTKNPQLYGIAKIEGKRILEIVEKPEKGREPSDIKIVGVYFLEPQFFDFYKKIKKHQYDFESALSVYMKEKLVEIKILKKSEKETLSLKYPWHLFEISKYLMDRYLKRKISKKAKIGKNVILEGKIQIEEGVKIFDGAVIKGPVYLGKDSIVGTNSLIRDYTNLENNVLIGALAEVKNCIFQENVHTHSGYFGDSIFGKNCKIGAGTITANLRLDRKEIKTKVKGKKINTGLKNFGVILGEDVKIGIHCSLMPGILIGSNSAIGPCSIIFENIKDNKQLFKQN